MSTAADPRLLWVERMPPRPLCDVPWFGNSIVMSDGTVNFCCHSNGVAGNVNEASFEEIWNGEVMRSIRRELAAQRLPVLCQTPSCPIHRGDTSHFLLDRSGKASSHPLMIGPAVRPMVASWFRDSRVAARRRRRLRAPVVDLEVEIRYRGPHTLAADLFVGLAPPGGEVLFLPARRPSPEPLRFDIPLSPAAAGVDLRLSPSVRASERRGSADSEWEICVALFIASANPLAANQCLWSGIVRA